MAHLNTAESSQLPPEWMVDYMAQVKEEIKKEVLDELLGITARSGGKRLLVAAENPDDDSAGASSSANDAVSETVIHEGIFCDNCDQLIHGIRYKCGNCSDFNLCQECESLPNVHSRNHVLLKIRFPEALRLFQRQKWQELMAPLPPPTRKTDVRMHPFKNKKLYEATFLYDVTFPDNSVLPPSVKFIKSWRVVNSGARVWTHQTKLCFIQGSASLEPDSGPHVDVPHLRPDEEGVVSVGFTSPAEPGVYRSHWNFHHRGRPFGHIVWCHVVVKAEGERGEEVPEKTLNKVSSMEKVLNEKANTLSECIEKVKEQHEKGNMIPRKLDVSSHTATPNNTPFDLTPPKSPDHRERSLNMIQEIVSISSGSHKVNEDDLSSVLSLSNSDTESDTEFVVIPMPSCFNMSESYLFRNKADAINHPTGLNHILNDLSRLDLPSSSSHAPTPADRPITTENIISQETGVPEIASEIVVKVTETEATPPDVKPPDQSVAAEGCSYEEVMKLLTNGDVTVKVLTYEDEEEEREEPEASSATFPKFPMEVPNAADPTEDQATVQDTPTAPSAERTVQVLPEGLVTGALSAAASVYNTAKGIINTIQHQPRATDRPPMAMFPAPNPMTTSMQPMDQLYEMGFCNRFQNAQLLRKHKDDVALAVAELVSLNDNDWHASRHTASPSFD